MRVYGNCEVCSSFIVASVQLIVVIEKSLSTKFACCCILALRSHTIKRKISKKKKRKNELL